MRLTLLVLPLFVAGCSTTPQEMTHMLQMQKEIKPIAELDCPEGCNFKYYGEHAQNVRMPTNGWDFATGASKMVKDVLLGASPWVVIDRVAGKAIQKGDNNSINNSYNPNSSVNGSNNPNNSINDSNNPNNSTNNPDSSIDNTDNSDNSIYDNDVDNSNNSQQPDNSVVNWQEIP